MGIEKLDSVADCCSDSVCGGTPCNMSTLPMHFDGKPWAATSGSFAVATYFATFFLMEALNGHPTFAQGKLSLEEVVQLFSVNSGGLEQMDNAFTAKSWASTLLSYVLASFDQTAMASPIPGLLHSPETEVVHGRARHERHAHVQAAGHALPVGWLVLEVDTPRHHVDLRAAQGEHGGRRCGHRAGVLAVGVSTANARRGDIH